MTNDKIQKEYDIFIHDVVWLRNKHKLSKKEMAKILGIGIGSLTKLERGQLPPRIRVNVLFAVYDHFGISPTQQLTQWLED